MKRTHVTMVALVPAVFFTFSAYAIAQGTNACTATAADVERSCMAAAKSDYSLALAKCDNLSDPSAQKTCQKQAAADLKDAEQTCQEQQAARQAACDKLGGAPYRSEEHTSELQSHSFI